MGKMQTQKLRLAKIKSDTSTPAASTYLLLNSGAKL